MNCRAITLLLFVLIHVSQLSAQRYELVWADEFNGTAVNPSSWNVWEGTAYNNELQFYTSRSKNVRIEDGILLLEAHKEYYGGRNYTSARIFTKDFHFWKYGRFEARIKQPNGRGFWPAFWLMPQYSVYGGWPNSGEIDIMEFRGNRVKEQLSTIHFARGGSRQLIGKTTEMYVDLTEDFHVYAVEWTNNGFVFSVDSFPHFTINREQVIADNYPFDEAFYIILNLAVGGDFLDNPDENTPFPTSFQVDWVRVYQDVNKLPYLDTNERAFDVKGSDTDKIHLPSIDEDGTVDFVQLRIPDLHVDTLISYADSLPIPFLPKGEYKATLKLIDNNTAWSEDYSITIRSSGGIETQKSFLETTPSTFNDFSLAWIDKGGLDISFWAPYPYTFYDNPIQNDLPFQIKSENEMFTLNTEKAGSWAEYSFYFDEEKEINLDIGVKAQLSNSRFSVYLDEEWLTMFSRVSPSDTFKYISKGPFIISAGNHVLKIQSDSDGLSYSTMSMTTVSTSIEPESNFGNTDNDFKIMKAYPNPFNPQTTVQFQLSKPGMVKASVYTIHGKEVLTYNEQYYSAGTQNISVSMDGFTSGTYWVQLMYQNRKKVVPITLIK
ncbi:glycosyl hydrolase family protein [bacterium]|nr:MAG: glycosyl hydrolase family protein [bacterium]